jgi:diacylglycerol kinase family enzyme
LLRALGSTAECDVEETAHRGHAAALACRAMRNGTDAVVAFGGDGTVNEVVNGLLTDGLHERVPALGIVPAGSTNVFARALGLPNSAIEATGVVLEALRSGLRRPVSMGHVDTGIEQRWFVFAAGMGLDAAIVEAVERHRRRGARSTHVLYTRVGVRRFFQVDRRRPVLTVELPDGRHLEDIFFAIVTNADPWTFVGNRPLRPTPGTSLHTGLGVYARRRMGTAGMLYSMARLMGERPRIGNRGAYLVEDLNGCVVKAREAMPVQVDGDYLGLRERLEFRTTRRAVAILMAPDGGPSGSSVPGDEVRRVPALRSVRGSTPRV